MGKALEDFRFRDAQFHMMNLARVGNKFLADTEPWKLAKEDMEAVGCILNYALTVVGNISLACEPFLPNTAKKIQSQLNVDANLLSKKFWKTQALVEPVGAGHQLNAASLLFKNVEDAEIEIQVEKLRKVKAAKMEVASPVSDSPVKPLKDVVTIDDFGKLDIRVGTVTAATKMEKSDKLLKLTIDSGLDTRTILSGIAKHYTPEEVIGKQVTFIANLAPRKMMGTESQGMILMAEDSDGKLRLLQPNEVVRSGSIVS
jgi:methionyl-tRNA synthetase